MKSDISQHGDFGLSFAEVEAVLASVSNIRSARRSRFQARLKNLLKLDFLPHAQRGRGRLATYSAGDVLRFAVAVELLQFGMGPARAIKLIEDFEPGFERVSGWLAEDGDGPRDPIVFRFDPRDLAEFADVESMEIGPTTFHGWIASGNVEIVPGELRLAILSVSELIARVAGAIEHETAASGESFLEALR